MDRSESPLEAVAGSTGEAATAAFEALSNETRLAILVALWEAYEPFESDEPVSFSALRERVGLSDSGQFNYHLEKLEGHFVESADGGYRLREAGRKFVQTVVAGAGIDDASLEPTRIDMACGLCGGPVEVDYRDEYVYNRCTECDGLWTDDSELSGQLSKFTLDPAGLNDRTPGELYAAAWVRGYQKLFNMLEGICSTCSGRVERSIEVCHDHEADGVCERCGRRHAVGARFSCTVCKESARSPLGTVAKYHPAVVAFHHDHDVDLQYGIADLDRINRRIETGETEWELLRETPPRARVTTRIADDEISIVLDEDLEVLEIEE